MILLCVSFSALLNWALRRGPGNTIHTVDFAEIYYGDRCALQHQDPYDPGTVLREFLAQGGKFPPDVPGKPISDSKVAQIVLSNSVNLPTSFFLVLPLALLPWSITAYLWVWLSVLLLAVAAWLVWDLGAGASPAIWAWLAGFLLSNSQQLIATGNVAGAAVGLCIIAVWCFLKNRFVLAGVVLLAFSLLLKPHDAGFIWLYFLLAGGALRKRALQTLAVTAVLGLCTFAWISRISPHWYPELHRNIAFEVARGGIDDPGPTGAHQNTPAPVIDLQAAISVFKDDAGSYNIVSYLVIGVLILAWIVVVLRKRPSPQGALFALAPVAALTLLPVYHRPYDAKLLLLTLPACALLWAAKAPRRWIALALTAAAIFITSDIPLAMDVALGQSLSLSTNTFAGKLATVLLLRPAPLILLAVGCFYLWVYVRYEPPADLPPLADSSTAPAAAAAT
ncbi:MAG TPA: glycosyltransferase family 87 protein [Terracidiphilus sp.]|nr:glycosyltransferase family 87 protein [Terracidiphilus sp.]